MKGVRSLEMLHKYGSTSRVLNLLRVFETHGKDREYFEKPLFLSPKLNRAIIVKHSLRADEEYVMQRKRKVTTKIIFPLVKESLSFGGQSIFVGQVNYRRAMVQAMGGDSDDLRVDIEILQMIDRLPSFDPFLLREYLRRNGKFAADCYFDISPADIERMKGFAAEEVSRLVNIAFTGGGNNEGSAQMVSKMVELILSNQADEKLDPFRVALGLEGDAFKEGVFAWRGFVYFKWQLAHSVELVGNILQSIDRVVITTNQDFDVKRNIADLVVHLKEEIKKVVFLCQQTMALYDKAFDDLVDRAHAAAFREFLLNGPSLFVNLGIMMGNLTHITSFWNYRFPNPKEMEIDCLDYEALLMDFLNGLKADSRKTILAV